VCGTSEFDSRFRISRARSAERGPTGFICPIHRFSSTGPVSLPALEPWGNPFLPALSRRNSSCCGIGAAVFAAIEMPDRVCLPTTEYNAHHPGDTDFGTAVRNFLTVSGMRTSKIRTWFSYRNKQEGCHDSERCSHQQCHGSQGPRPEKRPAAPFARRWRVCGLALPEGKQACRPLPRNVSALARRTKALAYPPARSV